MTSHRTTKPPCLLRFWGGGEGSIRRILISNLFFSFCLCSIMIRQMSFSKKKHACQYIFPCQSKPTAKMTTTTTTNYDIQNIFTVISFRSTGVNVFLLNWNESDIDYLLVSAMWMVLSQSCSGNHGDTSDVVVFPSSAKRSLFQYSNNSSSTQSDRVHGKFNIAVGNRGCWDCILI